MKAAFPPPLSVLETWPTPNYTDPATHGSLLFVLGILVVGLLPMVVAGRLWARICVVNKAGLDDWVFCAAIPPIMGFNVCCLIATQQYQFDRHTWDVEPDLFVPSRLLIYIAEVCNHVGSGLLKISILLFYRRLSEISHNMLFLYVVRLAIAFVVLWTLAILVVLLMACRPLSAFWESASLIPMQEPYTCLEEGVYWPLNICMSVVTDIMSVLIPIWMVSTMSISQRQKRMVYTLFCFGLLPCIAGVFRLIYTIRPLLLVWDIYWEVYNLCIAAIIEINLGVVICSVPALKSFFNPDLRNRAYGNSSTYVRTLNTWRAEHDSPPKNGPVNGDSNPGHLRQPPQASYKGRERNKPYHMRTEISAASRSLSPDASVVSGLSIPSFSPNRKTADKFTVELSSRNQMPHTPVQAPRQ